MFKKLMLIAMTVAGLSFISLASAAEVHWWHYPDKYTADFEAWYPANVEVWNTYYTPNKHKYVKFCESHRGWTFCSK